MLVLGVKLLRFSQAACPTRCPSRHCREPVPGTRSTRARRQRRPCAQVDGVFLLKWQFREGRTPHTPVLVPGKRHKGDKTQAQQARGGGGGGGRASLKS